MARAGSWRNARRVTVGACFLAIVCGLALALLHTNERGGESMQHVILPSMHGPFDMNSAIPSSHSIRVRQICAGPHFEHWPFLTDLARDVLLAESNAKLLTVTVPFGVKGGDSIRLRSPGLPGTYLARVPPGLQAGQSFRVEIGSSTGTLLSASTPRKTVVLVFFIGFV